MHVPESESVHINIYHFLATTGWY